MTFMLIALITIIWLATMYWAEHALRSLWRRLDRQTELLGEIEKRMRSGALLALAIALLPGAVWAHGGDGALIHACITRSTLVRIIAAFESCKPSEHAVHWPATATPAGTGEPSAAAELIRIVADRASGSRIVFTVPSDQRVVITDIWTERVGCCNGSDFLEIRSGALVVLQIIIPGQRSFASGLVLSPGETIHLGGGNEVRALLTGYVLR